MIEICVNAHRGEGALKSICDIVKGLIKQNDCYKVFVIDDVNSIYNGNMLGSCNIICKLNESSFLSAMQAKGKITLIKNDNIFAASSDLYIKVKELFESLENNAKEKVYFIYKDVQM